LKRKFSGDPRQGCLGEGDRDTLFKFSENIFKYQKTDMVEAAKAYPTKRKEIGALG
jgi:hypothetical protein